MDLKVIYSSASLLAINKPPGLPVHEAPGPGSSVLRELATQKRLTDLTPVHRLDKDASGVLLLAKNRKAASAIQREWDRVVKTYTVLCEGAPSGESGVIDAPILEHQTGKPERLANAVKYFKLDHPEIELPPLPEPKTSAVHPAGRESRTAWRVIETFTTAKGKWCLLEVRPEQGRMHQIRVHLKHLGVPLAADRLYGNRSELCQRDIGGDGDAVILTRMPLHAARLEFPSIDKKGETIRIEAPLLADMADALRLLHRR